MIHFNVQAVLDARGKSRYWLWKQTGMSYQNLVRLLENKTKGVRLETVEILCQVLECTPSDLFLIDPDLPEGSAVTAPPAPGEAEDAEGRR